MLLLIYKCCVNINPLQFVEIYIHKPIYIYIYTYVNTDRGGERERVGYQGRAHWMVYISLREQETRLLGLSLSFGMQGKGMI